MKINHKKEDTHKPEHITQRSHRQALQLQFRELNTRSRWYSSQLWQIPFAYLGVTGIVLGRLAGESRCQLSLGLLCSGIFGILVSVHIFGLMNGEKRAVTGLEEVESKLGLEPTAKYKPFYVIPLALSVVCATIFYFLAFILIIIIAIKEIPTH